MISAITRFYCVQLRANLSKIVGSFRAVSYGESRYPPVHALALFRDLLERDRQLFPCF